MCGCGYIGDDFWVLIKLRTNALTASLSPLFLPIFFPLNLVSINWRRLAGQVGWTVSIAPDSIKSQIQTSDVKIRILETAKHIYKMRGLRGFFAGIEVAVLRAFPANAALFMGYEYSKQMLGRFGL